MMYGFVFGENPELSKEELFCYLEKENIRFHQIDQKGDILILETSNIQKDIADHLGGTLKVFEVILTSDHINSEIMQEFANKIKINEKFSASVYNLEPKLQTEIGMLFKKKYKKKFFRTKKPYVSSLEMMKKKISFDVVLAKADKFYFGKTISYYNPFEYKKLDIARPKQRAMLSMPIRLARMMVNLSKVKSGKILDPFCGYGTILQEILLSGNDAYGSDLEDDCIDASSANLSWLSREFKIKNGFEVKQCNAIKLTGFFEKEFDAVVSEGYLGPPLRKSVSEDTAKKIIKDLEVFYKDVFNEISNVTKNKARIIFALPIIITKKKIFRIDKSVLGKLKLKKSFDFYREKHIVGREIWIIEK